jgi:hypothetical protein
MFHSKALTGGPEPRAMTYGPTLTCPHCDVRREHLRCATEGEIAPGRAWRSPFGWQAICGSCGENFALL